MANDFPEDCLAQYLSNIPPLQRLTLEREQELVAVIHNKVGNVEEAVQELVSAHLRLVVSIALQFRHYGLPIGDIVSDGNYGLVKAAYKAKPSKARFVTYATYWIRQSIITQAPKRRKGIAIPHHIQVKLRKLENAERALTEKLARNPSPEEIAKESGLPVKTIQVLLDCRRPACDIDASETQTIPNDLPSPIEEAGKKEQIENLIKCLSKLTKKEQQVIAARYGIDCSRQTLEEIGKNMKLSKERVRQVENSALEKLRVWKKEI